MYDNAVRRTLTSVQSMPVALVMMIVSGITRFLDELFGQIDGCGEAEELGYRGRPDGPCDCVVLIDASPSMMEADWKPTRLRGAKDAAKAYGKRIARNDPESRIAIVAYAAFARKAIGLTAAHQCAKLCDAIDQIDTFSATNITSALKKANRLLRKGRGNHQVILLTDGHHNFGVSPRRAAAKLRRHAILECVGIGGREGVDEELLRAIASTRRDGTKRYRWIGDPEDLIEHFENLAERITRQA